MCKTSQFFWNLSESTLELSKLSSLLRGAFKAHRVLVMMKMLALGDPSGKFLLMAGCIVVISLQLGTRVVDFLL